MESPEFKTLVQCFPNLVTIVQLSPNTIADHPAISTKLPQRKVQYLRNPSHEDEDKARELLDSIKDQVEIDPQVFHGFKSALESQGDWTKAAVDKLESTFEANSAIINSCVATSIVQGADSPHTSESTLSIIITGIFMHCTTMQRIISREHFFLVLYVNSCFS